MGGKARLIPLEGESAGSPIFLHPGIQTIGRKAPCDIIIADKSVSQKHAELELQDDHLLIKDLDSTNGLFFNDDRIRNARVYDQDYFAVGNVFFRFESGEDLPDIIRSFKGHIIAIRDEINRKIIGQEQVVEELLASFFGGGHCLLIGVPGLAKTVLAKTLAQVLDIRFKRVQFTPDLMPSDITGATIIHIDDDGHRDMRFEPGPIFTQFLLADEINRTPPKTQAALLEAMQEHQVTAGTETMPLPAPFFVVATQNPIEQEGTYPLPEAQLDRFMFSIQVDYPSLSEEEEILRRTTTREPMAVRKILNRRQILRYQNAVQQVEVAPYVISFATSIVRATRPQDEASPAQIRESLEWGAGPRAGQYLIWGAKIFAAMDGRLSVSCADIRRCAGPVLRHRISLNFQAQAGGLSPQDIVNAMLQLIDDPEIAKYS